jgi:hypothetical protein
VAGMGSAMKKYFFDVVGESCSQYDFHGRSFAEPQKAFQLAHLLALDMEVGYADEYAGAKIDVRSADGHQLFCVPIRQPEAIAA